MKRSIRLFTIWSLVWALLGSVTIAFFDSMAENQDELMKVYATMPKEFLAAFGVDPTKTMTIERFINTEFTMMYMLAGSILAVYLGVNIIGGEISKKSISFLMSRPVSRLKIYTSKVLAITATFLFSNIFLVIVLITSVLAFSDEAEINYKFFFCLSLGLIIFELVFLLGGVLMGIIYESGKATGMGMLTSIVLFFVTIFSAIPDVPEEIEYLTPYKYFDLDYLGNEHMLKYPDILILVLVSAILFVAGAYVFKRKSIDV